MGQNIRLKGMIYEQDFRFGKELRADIERASESYRADRSNRVQEARTTLDRLTERKRESNQQRYPRAERTDTPDYVKNLEYRSHSHRYGYRPSMGDFGISEPQNQGKRRPDRPTERHDTEIDRRRGQLDHNQLPRQQEPQTLVHQDEHTGRQLARGLSRPNGVLNHDRVGTAATQALEQMQNEQQTQQNALRQMFESTKQDNQALRQSLAVFLDGLTETDKNRNENLNKLARQISSLNKQVQDFNEQTATLSKQIQVLEQQVLKLKK
jgi:chromosome segregation ATPase